MIPLRRKPLLPSESARFLVILQGAKKSEIQRIRVEFLNAEDTFAVSCARRALLSFAFTLELKHEVLLN